jgi:hypothetical protein
VPRHGVLWVRRRGFCDSLNLLFFAAACCQRERCCRAGQRAGVKGVPMEELKRKFIMAILAIILGQSGVQAPAATPGASATPSVQAAQAQLVEEVGARTERAMGQLVQAMQSLVGSLAGGAAQGAMAPDKSAPFFWPRFLSGESIQRTVREGRFDPTAEALSAAPAGTPAAPGATATPTPAPAPAVPAAAVILPVYPILEMVEKNADGTYTAYFGYENKNAAAVTVPLGPENSFAPDPPGRGQPTLFQPGRTPAYPHCPIKIVFAGGTLRWTLQGQTATALVLGK